MLEFAIRLGSVQDVQDFVAIATTYPFSITVRDEHNKIKAESFMELFCLNFTHPLRVICECNQEELDGLMQDMAHFVVKAE
jgi:phosphotransferase system HPr-like phosphotransfer protein